MLGIVDERRTNFDWNSGTKHFWGIPEGRFRGIHGVRFENGEPVYPLFEDANLNHDMVNFGHDDVVGVLVDMDSCDVHFYRNVEYQPGCCCSDPSP